MSHFTTISDSCFKIPKINLVQEKIPVLKEDALIKKLSKLSVKSYPFMDPLPKDMSDCRPSQFKDTPIDWKMLTSSRPQNKTDEQLFTRIVEMSRLQYNTKIVEDEENYFKKRNGRLYVYESESSEDEDFSYDIENFVRNENPSLIREKSYKSKTLTSKELIDKLSDLMSGKPGKFSRRKTKKLRKKKQTEKDNKKDVEEENNSSSKDSSCSEETDLGSSDSESSPPTPPIPITITIPITTSKPRKKILTKRSSRIKSKKRNGSSKDGLLGGMKAALPKLERQELRPLPKLDNRPSTTKIENRNKVLYIRLPQIGN